MDPVTAVNDPASPGDGDSAPPSPRSVFSGLMRQHHRELVIYAQAVTGDYHAAQDLVQDAFVTAYGKFASFERERDFGAWMRGILRNKCRDWFRSRGRRPLAELDATEIEVDLATWQEAVVRGQSSVIESLENCLAKLPDRLRESVQAFYFRHLNGDDAAAELGISSVSLRKRLQRARTQLHDCITRNLPMANPSTHV